MRLGEHNLATERDCDGPICAAPPQDFTPSEVILHPNYKTRNVLSDDIALIRLDRKANLNGKNSLQAVLPPIQLHFFLTSLIDMSLTGLCLFAWTVCTLGVYNFVLFRSTTNSSSNRSLLFRIKTKSLTPTVVYTTEAHFHPSLPYHSEFCYCLLEICVSLPSPNILTFPVSLSIYSHHRLCRYPLHASCWCQSGGFTGRKGS